MLYPGPMKYEVVAHPTGDDEYPTLQLLSQGTWGEAVSPQIQSFMEEGWRQATLDIPAEAPLFRPLTAFQPPPFLFKVVGSYDFAALAAPQDPLSYVPLGIYEPPLATLRYNDQGIPVEPVRLTPGLNPAGSIPRPPLALTTLEAAEFFRGEAAIDAIRVRVGGIEGYTPENVAKVERVAREIVERTGLHVDIVAGSSPRAVLVQVPGVGYVEQRWTTLGAAAQITGGINAANFTLLACLLLASGLYIGNAAQLSILARREEIGLLKAVGWHTSHVRAYLLSELLLLGLLGAALATLMALALVRLLGLEPLWPIIGGAALLAPLLYGLSALYPIQQAVRRPPTEALRQGEVRGTQAGQLGALPLSLFGLAVRHLWRRRTRTLLIVLIVAAGVALSVMLAAVVVQLNGLLRVTLLGDYVALSIRPYHYLMMLTALAVGVLAIGETLLVSVLERTREFAVLRALGWQRVHLTRTVLWEGVLIGALGGLLGAIVGALLFWSIAGSLPPVALGVAALASLGAMALGGGAALYPAQRAARVPPAQVLSGADERRRGGPRHPAWRWGVGFAGLLLFALLVATALWGNEPVNRVREVAGIGATPAPTVHPAQQAVSGERALAHVERLVELGPRTLGNEAQVAAAEYIHAQLTSYGLQVEREPFPLRMVTFSDAAGVPLLSVPSEEGGSVRGLAVNFDEVDVTQPITGTVMLLDTDAPWPAPETLVDQIVIIVEEKPFNDDEDPNRPMRDLLAHYGYPFPFRAAVYLWPDELSLEEVLQPGGTTVCIMIAENIVATLPGQEQPDQELWLMAPYDNDASRGGVGADDNGSGVGVLLEVARVLAERGSPVTVRFVALAGSTTGLQGSMAHFLAHESPSEQLLGIVGLQRLGAWDELGVGHVLEAPTRDGELPPEQVVEMIREDGQGFLRTLWLSVLDLSDPQLLSVIDERLASSGGLSESPPQLVEQALAVAESVGVPATPRHYPCATPDYLMYLYQELPTIAFCGIGNDLAGTEYDTVERIQPIALQRAAAVVYQLIEELGGR